MKIKFTEILKDCHIDQVIIENQIGPLANRMKTIQGMVIQHFIEHDIYIIKEISACNKLKKFLKPHQKTTYHQRKKIAIDITQTKINTSPIFNEWRDFFNSHKKKDDLADSFLQALWYLQSLKMIE